MTTFPNSPKIAKGALIGIDLLNPLASVVLFQYNPETVTRTIKPRSVEDASKVEARRLTGPPLEEIKMDVEIDATDQLEKGDGIATSMGIYPQLSALEMLVYPKSALTIANTILLAAGTMEIIPPSGPFTVLVWGAKRVLPVKLTDFSVTEDMHDVNLNPIRAKVSLGLTVLSTNDLPITDPGYYMFLAHQVTKEAMAVVGSMNGLGDALGGDVRLF